MEKEPKYPFARDTPEVLAVNRAILRRVLPGTESYCYTISRRKAAAIAANNTAQGGQNR